MKETAMKGTAVEITMGKQEYKKLKKLKKLLKKAYKATVKENQLWAYIENAKKNFPGYTDADKAYNEAPKGADSVQYAAFKLVESNFYQAYAEQIDEYHKAGEKAFRLRVRVSGKLSHAGEKESEEE